jgi:DNA polymerase III subunit alpha
MQIAQVLAGYTLGGADLLRRAMGKKKPEEMAKQREIFVRARARGVSGTTATYIFDLMEKFAGYGFNKSHSAAYALVSYQTAWLKAHYPAAFMAAVLSADMDNTDKVVYG